MGTGDDYMAAVLLDNIMRVMADISFSKDLSAYIVGGEKKLLTFIEAGEIESDKPCNKQNGKWRCNAAQVLRHCRCVPKSNRKNRKK